MFNFIFIAKLDGAQKLQCLLRDQGFWPVNLYNAEKAEEPCFFFYPSWRCINHVGFLMRSINLKRRELYQNLTLPKHKSLVLKYPTELPVTLLRGRMCTQLKSSQWSHMPWKHQCGLWERKPNQCLYNKTSFTPVLILL